jgi:iron complex transport system substrate-binding protein
METAIGKHLATMKSIAAQMPTKDSRTAIYADTEPPNFQAHSANQWEPQIMASVGLRSVLPPKPGSRNISLTLEQLFSYNPQVMFLGSNGEKGIVQQWQSSPVWKQISAVQNKDVFTVNDQLWSQERGLKDAEQVLRDIVTDLRGRGQ